jgi:Ser/Thr protein kinase RdoA (MazF antagonist)
VEVRIADIVWQEQEEAMNTLLAHDNEITLETLNQGFEAEVMKLNLQQESFVLKVWNKESNPNIERQYRLLKWLSERGMNVSRPIGWGIDANGNKVLLTTYDGGPLERINAAMMSEFARILSQLHRFSTEDEYSLLPNFDLIDYFFPGVSEHADLFQVLTHFVQLAQIKHDRFIHGDYHMNNIVVKDKHYTVIDWTNGQMGDSRYDFAWTLVLVKIYLGPKHADAFRSAYLIYCPLEQQEIDLFEAIACVRWILLNRRDGVPRSANTLQKVKKLIDSNPFLRACPSIIKKRSKI